MKAYGLFRRPSINLSIMKYIFTSIMLLFMLESCELFQAPPDCNNSGKLTKRNISKDTYDEIVFSYLQKSKPEDYRYFFKTFIEKGNDTFMVVNFRKIVSDDNRHFEVDNCFDVEVLVEDWSILGGMRKVNGKSYPKELRKLRWELKEVKIVKYTYMDRIID